MDAIKEFFKKPEGMVAAAVAAIALVSVIVYVLISGDDDADTEDTDESTATETPEPEDRDYSAAVEDEDEDDEDSTAQGSLTNADVEAIEQTVREIVFSTAEFGLDRSGFSGQVTESEIISDDIFISRAESYESIRDQIATTSELYYSEDRVQGWDEDAFAGFSVSDVSIDDIVGPVMENIEGSNVRSVDVELNWDGTEFYYEVTATDTAWDGSYYLMEREYEEEGAVFNLIEEDGQWKLNAIESAENIHATALWSSPAPERMPFADQFEQVGTTEATREPFDEETLEPAPDPSPSYNELDDLIESDIDRGFRDRMYSPPRDLEDD